MPQKRNTKYPSNVGETAGMCADWQVGAFKVAGSNMEPGKKVRRPRACYIYVL